MEKKSTNNTREKEQKPTNPSNGEKPEAITCTVKTRVAVPQHVDQ